MQKKILFSLNAINPIDASDFPKYMNHLSQLTLIWFISQKILLISEISFHGILIKSSKTHIKLSSIPLASRRGGEWYDLASFDYSLALDSGICILEGPC